VTTKLWPQPLIVVRDVPSSSRFYARILDAESGHGGEAYEQIVSDGEILLQLHSFEAEDHHGPLADGDQPLGNGLVLWFEVADFEAALDRVRSTGAPIVLDDVVNPNARQREIWFRDPDGYLVALASPSPYRPRA
jgi:catechol 2,3-dioxygenase-like lactoylglutathione lyase family enzyme